MAADLEALYRCAALEQICVSMRALACWSICPYFPESTSSAFQMRSRRLQLGVVGGSVAKSCLVWPMLISSCYVSWFVCVCLISLGFCGLRHTTSAPTHLLVVRCSKTAHHKEAQCGEVQSTAVTLQTHQPTSTALLWACRKQAHHSAVHKTYQCNGASQACCVPGPTPYPLCTVCNA